MSIKARYLQFQQHPDYQQDSAQQEVLEVFTCLEQQLNQRQPSPSDHSTPLAGLYIWGSVGRGKTLLMDLFFDEIEGDRKLRLHFHRFMQQVHQKLFLLTGTRNPLEKIADQFADQYDLLCFDEFFVSDIADAMILGTLTDALYQRGMVLVLTSNQHPDNLYLDGVQRDRFLPAIDNIKKHNRIFHLDGGLDHRLRPNTSGSCFFNETDGEQQLKQIFHTQTQGAPFTEETLIIEHRPIHCKAKSENIAWFDFEALCDGPRSQNDYIFLAKNFHTLIISGIPILGATGEQNSRLARGTEDGMSAGVANRVINNDDRTRRFISLVDELYDRSVNLYATVEAPIEQLYQGGHLEFEFQRTFSRLTEMQSNQYLQHPHKP